MGFAAVVPWSKQVKRTMWAVAAAMLATTGCASFRETLNRLEREDAGKGFRDSTATFLGPCTSNSQCGPQFVCVRESPNAIDGLCYARNSPEARNR